ncbi:MAG TPA: ABC transporter ATP-binding protein [Bacillota bacterium]|jgi:ABC-2 type transport system ATP-binding protein|nr:ABC transporter ATP-binding protein [Bacillota bacterium]
MLEIKDLAKTYPNGTEALKGVSFSVKPGEVLGILGPNGAGKTTLLKLLLGVLTPTQGAISLDGVSPQKSPFTFRKSIGVVHQFGSFDMSLSLWDNLCIYGAFHGISKRERETRVNYLLDEFDLTSKKKEPVNSLSGGQRRKAQIARALLHRPSFLFLDEPTTGLDVHSRKQAWEVIRKEIGPSAYVIFASHNVDEVEKQCDRVLIINQGELVALDSPQSLIDSVLGHRIEIALCDPPGEELVHLLLTEEWVYDVESENSRLRLRVNQPSQCLPRILECCINNGASVESVITKSPSLEDVFLKATGRELG